MQCSSSVQASSQQDVDWEHEFTVAQHRLMQDDVANVAESAAEAPTTAPGKHLSQTAAELLDTVKDSDEKFRNSAFLGFVSRIRDNKVTLDENENFVEKRVQRLETRSPAGSTWSTDFEKRIEAHIRADALRTGSLYTDADAVKLEAASAESLYSDAAPSATRQHTLHNVLSDDHHWIDEFLMQQRPERHADPVASMNDIHHALASANDWAFELARDKHLLSSASQSIERAKSLEQWEAQYRLNIAHLCQEEQDLEWERLEKSWRNRKTGRNYVPSAPPAAESVNKSPFSVV